MQDGLSGLELLTVILGVVLIFVGVIGYFVFAWFREGDSGDHNVIKILQAEFRITNPTILIFGVGVALLVTPLLLTPDSPIQPTPTPAPSTSVPSIATGAVIPMPDTPTPALPTLTSTPTPTSTSTPTPTPTATPTITATPTPAQIPVTPIPNAYIGEALTIFEADGSLFVSDCEISDISDGIRFRWDVSMKDSFAVANIPLRPDFSSTAVRNTHLIILARGENGGEKFRIKLGSPPDREWGPITQPMSASLEGRQDVIRLSRYADQGVDLADLEKLVIAFEYVIGKESRQSSICIGEIGFGSP